MKYRLHSWVCEDKRNRMAERPAPPTEPHPQENPFKEKTVPPILFDWQLQGRGLCERKPAPILLVVFHRQAHHRMLR